MNLNDIMIENKITIFSNIFESIKEIIFHYINNRLEQNHLEILFKLKKELFKKILFLYEELYYLNKFNLNEKNIKVKNEIIDDIINVDNGNNNKKNLSKNKINSFQLFELLNSNKYNKYLLKNQNIYFLLFNKTIILIKEICEIISIELKELENKSDEESLANKYIILGKNSSFLQKIFYYLSIIYIIKLKGKSYENSENFISNLLSLYINNVPNDLLLELFKKLLPSIIELFYSLNKKCQYILLDNLFSIEKNEKIKLKKNILIKFFFDYYSDRIYEIGNNNKTSLSDINIDSLIFLKNLYKYLFEEINNNNFESQIIPVVIDYIIISHKTNDPINYIFIF